MTSHAEAKQIIPFHFWTEKKNVEDEDGGETRMEGRGWGRASMWRWHGGPVANDVQPRPVRLRMCIPGAGQQGEFQSQN